MNSRAEAAATRENTFPLGDAAWRRRIAEARARAVDALLAERTRSGTWEGELSSSALSTATAITALTLVARGDATARGRLEPLITRGAAWLVRHQNPNGGWGDTVRSVSNISTTTLAWAALGLDLAAGPGVADAVRSAEAWIARVAGSAEPAALVPAIERRYGDDRTFSIPILTMCALCGRLGPGATGWNRVRQLPFEIAAFPQGWFGALRLPVVSYALPALIAIGQVRHGLRPTRNPLLRALRDRARARTLRKLGQLQPENGGFLEATPLTSFVTMSLAALGLTDHPVVRRGAAFIEASARPDGSWAIDTNLTTWVTTLSVHALAGPETGQFLPDAERGRIAAWLRGQQYRTRHPYTLAAPGGWAWTDLPGGVPDADDTPGALLALRSLEPGPARADAALEAGAIWLLDLQNRDGGIPTFCRGWGRLPFDRSSPDLTAHTLRAWSAVREHVSPRIRARITSASRRAVTFLLKTQRPDGTWIPLWFGHQEHPADENPLYGTTRVILALAPADHHAFPAAEAAVGRALGWLTAHQNPDGGWSGAHGAASSVEETGLAVEALATAYRLSGDGASPPRPQLAAALERGGTWLARAVGREEWRTPSPIGFYFAKLWYFERLYPLVFATAALTRLESLGVEP